MISRLENLFCSSGGLALADIGRYVIGCAMMDAEEVYYRGATDNHLDGMYGAPSSIPFARFPLLRQTSGSCTMLPSTQGFNLCPKRLVYRKTHRRAAF